MGLLPSLQKMGLLPSLPDRHPWMGLPPSLPLSFPGSRAPGHSSFPISLVIPRVIHSYSRPAPGIPGVRNSTEITNRASCQNGALAQLCSHAAAQPYSRSGHRQQRPVRVSLPVAPSVSTSIPAAFWGADPGAGPCRRPRQSRPFRGPGRSAQQPSGGLIRVLSARWPTSSSPSTTARA